MEENDEDMGFIVDPEMEIMDISDDDDDEGDEENDRPPNNLSLVNMLNRIGSAYYLRERTMEDGDDDEENDEENQNNSENVITENNVIKFDTELPAEHSYLGNMVRVSGVDYLEAGKHHRLLLFTHHSMVFPGEIFPMIVPNYMFDSTLLPEEGLLFGVTFPKLWNATKPNIYGVTCQIFEKGYGRENVIIKSRSYQRFIISKKYNTNFSELLKLHNKKVYANVKILPEIVLPDPLSSIDLGSMNRLRDIESMKPHLKRMQASTTPFPQFVYNRYNISSIIKRAKDCLFSYKIESMPTDLILLSFWLGRNLLFDADERIKIFLTDTVNVRLQIIEKSIGNGQYFCCRRCNNKISACYALFAMSKHGVQSNYCNSAGYIHETNTVYALIKDAVYTVNEPSTEFSWFPGYSWQLIICLHCDMHIGWKFVATKDNLLPKKFYGLSGTNVYVIFPENEQMHANEGTNH